MNRPLIVNRLTPVPEQFELVRNILNEEERIKYLVPNCDSFTIKTSLLVHDAFPITRPITCSSLSPTEHVDDIDKMSVTWMSKFGSYVPFPTGYHYYLKMIDRDPAEVKTGLDQIFGVDKQSLKPFVLFSDVMGNGMQRCFSYVSVVVLQFYLMVHERWMSYDPLAFGQPYDESYPSHLFLIFPNRDFKIWVPATSKSRNKSDQESFPVPPLDTDMCDLAKKLSFPNLVLSVLLMICARYPSIMKPYDFAYIYRFGSSKVKKNEALFFKSRKFSEVPIKDIFLLVQDLFKKLYHPAHAKKMVTGEYKSYYPQQPSMVGLKIDIPDINKKPSIHMPRLYTHVWFDPLKPLSVLQGADSIDRKTIVYHAFTILWYLLFCIPDSERASLFTGINNMWADSDRNENHPSFNVAAGATPNCWSLSPTKEATEKIIQKIKDQSSYIQSTSNDDASSKKKKRPVDSSSSSSSIADGNSSGFPTSTCDKYRLLNNENTAGMNLINYVRLRYCYFEEIDKNYFLFPPWRMVRSDQSKDEASVKYLSVNAVKALVHFGKTMHPSKEECKDRLLFVIGKEGDHSMKGDLKYSFTALGKQMSTPELTEFDKELLAMFLTNGFSFKHAFFVYRAVCTFAAYEEDVLHSTMTYLGMDTVKDCSRFRALLQTSHDGYFKWMKGRFSDAAAVCPLDLNRLFGDCIKTWDGVHQINQSSMDAVQERLLTSQRANQLVTNALQTRESSPSEITTNDPSQDLSYYCRTFALRSICHAITDKRKKDAVTIRDDGYYHSVLLSNTGAFHYDASRYKELIRQELMRCWFGPFREYVRMVAPPLRIPFANGTASPVSTDSAFNSIFIQVKQTIQKGFKRTKLKDCAAALLEEDLSDEKREFIKFTMFQVAGDKQSMNVLQSILDKKKEQSATAPKDEDPVVAGCRRFLAAELDLKHCISTLSMDRVVFNLTSQCPTIESSDIPPLVVKMLERIVDEKPIRAVAVNTSFNNAIKKKEEGALFDLIKRKFPNSTCFIVRRTS
jgi:hypothetical protein